MITQTQALANCWNKSLQQQSLERHTILCSKIHEIMKYTAFTKSMLRKIVYSNIGVSFWIRVRLPWILQLLSYLPTLELRFYRRQDSEICTNWQEYSHYSIYKCSTHASLVTRQVCQRQKFRLNVRRFDNWGDPGRRLPGIHGIMEKTLGSLYPRPRGMDTEDGGN
jgi:hypothetical protein